VLPITDYGLTRNSKGNNIMVHLRKQHNHEEHTGTETICISERSALSNLLAHLHRQQCVSIHTSPPPATREQGSHGLHDHG
jgi:hypothetical protein